MSRNVKRPAPAPTASKKKKKKKKKAVTVFLLSFLVIILLGIGLGIGFVASQLNKIKITPISKNREDLGISREAKKEKDIINIAFFGLDRRTKNEASRSDSIMIATIDKTHKKLKITSITRDTYVNIDGHGKDKLNHAYAFGGPQLAIKTLNKNFNLDITDYVAVDFYSFEKIIDSLGGVEIDVKKSELDLVNGYMEETSKLEGKKKVPVTRAGMQTLNGMQAVAYSRIRYVGDGDFERTERQRRVLNAIFEKVKSAGPAKFASIAATILPYTETSISKTDILSLGAETFTMGIGSLEQERFPLKKHSEGKIINGIWYYVTNLETTRDYLDKYLFEDIKPDSSLNQD